MALRKAAKWFVALTALYAVALMVLDLRRPSAVAILDLRSAAMTVLGAASASILCRYVRWHWLLRRAAARVPTGVGLLAYLSGFAFTATPGKLGELIRVRYLARLGLPGETVVGAFLFERLWDVQVVLVLACFGAMGSPLMPLAAGFVGLVTFGVFLLVAKPGIVSRLSQWMVSMGWPLTGAICATLGRGLAEFRRWVNARDIGVSLVSGLMAWSLTSYALTRLVWVFSPDENFLSVLPLYPLAMLAGAASFLPGGVGATEAALALLLTGGGVNLSADDAMVCALGIRVGTLWFAMALGLMSLTILEYRYLTPGQRGRVTIATEQRLGNGPGG